MPSMLCLVYGFFFIVVMSFCNFPISDGTRCRPRYVYDFNDLFCDNVGKYCPLCTMC
jgi:hypothetical protein